MSTVAAQPTRDGRLMTKMLTLHLTDLERKASLLLHAVSSMQDYCERRWRCPLLQYVESHCGSRLCAKRVT